jgi:hypothetical protein
MERLKPVELKGVSGLVQLYAATRNDIGLRIGLPRSRRSHRVQAVESRGSSGAACAALA